MGWLATSSSPALILEIESPRPESGLAWLLRLVLSSHLALPRCGSLIRGVAYLDLPTLTQPDSSGFLLTICSCSKGLKMARKEAGLRGKSFMQRKKTGPAELGPPSENQHKGPTHKLTCALSLPVPFSNSDHSWVAECHPGVSAPGGVNKSLSFECLSKRSNQHLGKREKNKRPRFGGRGRGLRSLGFRKAGAPQWKTF